MFHLPLIDLIPATKQALESIVLRSVPVTLTLLTLLTLLSACSLSLDGKDECNDDSDCIGARVCSDRVCTERKASDAGEADAASAPGKGPFDGGDDGPLSGSSGPNDGGEGVPDTGSDGSTRPHSCDGSTLADGGCAPNGDECAIDNGGCGDSTYSLCADTSSTTPSCSDIDECKVDNGGCPSLCNNNIAAAPTCSVPAAPCGNADIDFSTDVDVANKYSCCDTLNGTYWSAPVVKAGCDSHFGGGFGSDRTESVGSECDGSEDCGTDAFCCFVFSVMGPPPSFTPRPHGRRCSTQASCEDVASSQGASGVFSCNDVSDCPSGLTRCVPEPQGVTSGQQRGRPWVKVCAP